MTIARMAVGALAAAALVVMAGCSAPTPGGGAGSDDPADATTGPAIDLDCAGLLDLDVLGEAFAPEIAPIPLTFSGAGDYYELAQIGLAQAGALRCEWSDGGSPERYLTMSVLPAAADAWATQSAAIAIFQPLADSYGDASWHTCSDSGGYASCRIDVLADDRWLSAVLGGLTTMDAAADVIEAALAGLATASDLGTPGRGEPVASCDDLAPTDVVSATIGGAVERVELETPVQPVSYHAGFLVAGGTFCSWRNDLGSASALTASFGYLPGGAAAWDDFWADEPNERVDREAVADLGDAAYAGCNGDVHCFASVRIGDDWFQVTVNDEAVADERDRAIALAREVIETR
jgi:hypothetical protein